MNKLLKVLLIMTIISSLVLCGLLYMLINRGKKKEATVSKLAQFQENYGKTDTDSKAISPTVYTDFSAEAGDRLYDPQRHDLVAERIEAMKESGAYSEDDPLVIYNPYGINAQSLYLYFTTEQRTKMSYRVNVQGGDTATFGAVPVGGSDYANEHEVLLIGLATGENRVVLNLTDADGNTAVRSFYVKIDALAGKEATKLAKAKGTSEKQQADGMYVTFGNAIDGKQLMLLYDNDGALRSEILLENGAADRILFVGDYMYFSFSDEGIAEADRFGRVHRVFRTNGYRIGRDYCIDEAHNGILILADKAGDGEAANGTGDRVLFADLEDGSVKELLNMGNYLAEYKEQCKKNEFGELNWLGLNAITILGDGEVLFGAGEASLVIKMEDIYGVPSLAYLLGDPALFDDTGLENDILVKNGKFASFFGGNALTVESVEKKASGIYILSMFDNRLGKSESRPDVDFSKLEKDLGSGMKKGTGSYYVRYLVNETAKTWELAEAMPVDYSGYEGCTQVLPNDNLLVTCSGRFRFSEYDKERKAVCSFETSGDSSLPRVFKYDFKGIFLEKEGEKASEDTKNSGGKKETKTDENGRKTESDT